MKALITGAPGWLGTRLVENLLKDGLDIKCIIHPSMSDERLKKYNVETVKADITNPESLKNVCKDISIVFHCAAVLKPKNKNEFYEVNTLGTKYLLEEAINSEVSKFLYISSGSAGAGYSSLNIVKEADPPRPYMDYGLSKLKAEKILNDYHNNKKINVVIIRPGWLYGIDGPERQVKFLKAIKKGKTLVFGNGNVLRSLCNIENCVNGIMIAYKSEKALGQTYFIGDLKAYKLNDAYKDIAELLDIEYKPCYIPIPAYNTTPYDLVDRAMQGVRFYNPELHIFWDWAKNIVCSIEKAQHELNYKPPYNLKEGMKLAIEEYRKKGIEI